MSPYLLLIAVILFVGAINIAVLMRYPRARPHALPFSYRGFYLSQN